MSKDSIPLLLADLTGGSRTTSGCPAPARLRRTTRETYLDTWRVHIEPRWGDYQVRRTLPAMAATLATYTTVLLAMPLWIRAHLAPATTITVPFTRDRMANHLLAAVSHVDIDIPDTWNIAEQTLDATGHPAHAMPPAYADCDSIKACVDALAEAEYRQRVTYQAAYNFWWARRRLS